MFAAKVHEKYAYQRKGSFFYLLLLMCGDVEKCPGPTESNIKDLFNQKGLKVFHQNIRGLFHNIAKLSAFLHTHKNTHMFSSVKRTLKIQHQHSFLKFQGTPSLTKIEMLALTAALQFIKKTAYHLLEGLICKLMNLNVFGLK